MKFTKEELLAVQSEQLAEWKATLNPVTYQALVEWVEACNKEAKTPNDIVRGTQLTEFVCNFKGGSDPIETLLCCISYGTACIIAEQLTEQRDNLTESCKANVDILLHAIKTLGEYANPNGNYPKLGKRFKFVQD